MITRMSQRRTDRKGGYLPPAANAGPRFSNRPHLRRPETPDTKSSTSFRQGQKTALLETGPGRSGSDGPLSEKPTFRPLLPYRTGLEFGACFVRVDSSPV